MLDTPHPDLGMYKQLMLPIPELDYIYPLGVAFNQVKILPEQLLEGRMGIVISWIFSKLLYNEDRISEFDREVYTNAYNSAEAIQCIVPGI
jgi:hypothetical protein